MFRNYLTIAYRTLLRNRSYTVLNVLGLSLGLACGLLIFQVVNFQLGFDRYHTKADRTYQLVTELHFDHVYHTPGVPAPTGKALRAEYPFVEHTAMVIEQYNRLMTVLDGQDHPVKKFADESLAFVEPSYFQIFDYTWLRGTPETALSAPNGIVLTKRLAEKFFGAQNPIGKRLKMSNEADLVVTGLLADIPENTSKRYGGFLSFSTLNTFKNYGGPGIDAWNGINSGTHCYVTLREGTPVDRLRQALPSFSKKYIIKDWQEFVFVPIPMTRMRFESDYNGPLSQGQLLGLGLVGVFLVLTACINFVNLATAQALRRSKEVGVRKSVGGTRGRLFWQFITETGLITALALGLALLLVVVLTPLLNEAIEEQVGLNLLGTLHLQDPLFWGFLLVLGGVVTFLSGAYPGVVLSGLQPVRALKGTLSAQQVGGLGVRRGLVVGQFALTQLLLIGTLVLTQQMNFFRQRSIGYNPTALVLFSLPTNETARLSTLENRLRGVPGVEGLSFFDNAPTSGNNNTANIRFDTRQTDEAWQVNQKSADAHYLETFGLRLVAGRNLLLSDTIRGFLVNETFVRKLGLTPAKVLGRTVKLWGNRAPVIGVVNDWNNLSLHNAIDPVILFSQRGGYRTGALKIGTGEVGPTLKAIERIWNDTYPDDLYEQTFLDERIAGFYQTEALILQLIRTFSFIAILIGCLGLYGLVSFMAAQKTKEIGVRKVLGASVLSILGLFGKEFGRLVGLAFLVAAPLGGYVMSQWLNHYQYRVPLGWGVFTLALGVTIGIAALTIGYQSWKAAWANPVKSLRSE